jgi:hypothetical protein
MMCGRNEEPQPYVATCLKIVMAYAHYKVMNTRC